MVVVTLTQTGIPVAYYKPFKGRLVLCCFSINRWTYLCRTANRTAEIMCRLFLTATTQIVPETVKLSLKLKLRGTF